MADLLAAENVLSIFKGTSRTLKLNVVQADGSPQDINGVTLYFTVKRALTELLPVIQKKSTVPGEIDITAPDVGEAVISILPSDTQALEIRRYLYDVWIEFPDGRRFVLVPPSELVIERAVTSFG